MNNTNYTTLQEINLVVLNEDDLESSLSVQEEVFSGLSIYPNPTQLIQQIDIFDMRRKLIKIL